MGQKLTVSLYLSGPTQPSSCGQLRPGFLGCLHWWASSLRGPALPGWKPHPCRWGQQALGLLWVWKATNTWCVGRPALPGQLQCALAQVLEAGGCSPSVPSSVTPSSTLTQVPPSLLFALTSSSLPQLPTILGPSTPVNPEKRSPRPHPQGASVLRSRAHAHSYPRAHPGSPGLTIPV